MSAADKASSPSTDDKGSRDPKEIREEIEETRGELGETVAAVAEKTDVKKQAEAKKEDLKAQAGAKADELKGQASAKADEAKAKARQIGDKAKDAAPESTQEGVQRAQRLAQDNPVPLAISGAFVAGLLVGRLLSR